MFFHDCVKDYDLDDQRNFERHDFDEHLISDNDDDDDDDNDDDDDDDKLPVAVPDFPPTARFDPECKSMISQNLF